MANGLLGWVFRNVPRLPKELKIRLSPQAELSEVVGDRDRLGLIELLGTMDELADSLDTLSGLMPEMREQDKERIADLFSYRDILHFDSALIGALRLRRFLKKDFDEELYSFFSGNESEVEEALDQVIAGFEIIVSYEPKLTKTVDAWLDTNVQLCLDDLSRRRFRFEPQEGDESESDPEMPLNCFTFAAADVRILRNIMVLMSVGW